ncbi:MAG: hypothetical protein AAF564_10535 [Bacteroidota bacterium]
MHNTVLCKPSFMRAASGLLLGIIVLSTALLSSACLEPDPKVWKLDQDYGFRGYSLGPSLYTRVLEQAEGRATAFDVVEFEAFGSRFADQQLFEQQGPSTVFGTPVAKVYAGVIDESIYAFLLQVGADHNEQAALEDSLIFHYGTPQSRVDTTYISGQTLVHVNTLHWEADSVGLELGMGDGFAELLVYDKDLRLRRQQIQYLTTRAQRGTNTGVSELKTVGQVNLDEIAPRARWKYRYRGEETHVRGGSFGEIDYSYVKPFFEVEGESFFGVKMAFVNLNFVGGSDSLRTLEVRFDNTQGQTVGFMDMLRVMERKLGRHAYSDTLHTTKGPFRRATWYGHDLTITLEENRFRPEQPDRADVLVSFTKDRIEVPWQAPDLARAAVNSADSLDVGSGGGQDSLATKSELISKKPPAL